MAQMLNEIKGKGYSDPYLERIIGLKHGSLAKWRKGKASATEKALVRMIHAFPSLILDVAENNFDPAYAKGRVVVECGIQIIRAVK